MRTSLPPPQRSAAATMAWELRLGGIGCHLLDRFQGVWAVKGWQSNSRDWVPLDAYPWKKRTAIDGVAAPHL